MKRLTIMTTKLEGGNMFSDDNRCATSSAEKPIGCTHSKISSFFGSLSKLTNQFGLHCVANIIEDFKQILTFVDNIIKMDAELWGKKICVD